MRLLVGALAIIYYALEFIIILTWGLAAIIVAHVIPCIIGILVVVLIGGKK